MGRSRIEVILDTYFQKLILIWKRPEDLIHKSEETDLVYQFKIQAL
jgi:hypothetical protein